MIMKKIIIAALLVAGLGAFAFASLNGSNKKKAKTEKQTDKQEKKKECKRTCIFG
jgi:flagellar basal body-associated protein FliL